MSLKDFGGASALDDLTAPDTGSQANDSSIRGHRRRYGTPGKAHSPWRRREAVLETPYVAFTQFCYYGAQGQYFSSRT